MGLGYRKGRKGHRYGITSLSLKGGHGRTRTDLAARDSSYTPSDDDYEIDYEDDADLEFKDYDNDDDDYDGEYKEYNYDGEEIYDDADLGDSEDVDGEGIGKLEGDGEDDNDGEEIGEKDDPEANQGEQGQPQPLPLSAAKLSEGEISSATSGDSRVNSTPIIAGVLSIIAIAVFSTIGFLLYRRRRGRSHQRFSGGPVDGSGKDIEGSLGQLTVTHSYAKSLPDEIDLRVGDIVNVIGKYDDGWGRGENLTTGETGSFPYVCLGSSDVEEKV